MTRWHVVLLAARTKKKALGTPGAEQVPVVGWVARQGLCRCLSFLPTLGYNWSDMGSL